MHALLHFSRHMVIIEFINPSSTGTICEKIHIAEELIAQTDKKLFRNHSSLAKAFISYLLLPLHADKYLLRSFLNR